MKNTFDIIPNLSFSISSGMVWGLVAFIISAFALLSTVLVFHWQRYGMGNRRIFIAQILFFVVSGCIILLMFAAALALV